MRKLYTLLLIAMLLPVFAMAQEYCTPSGTPGGSDRYINTLTVSDNNGNNVVVEVEGVGATTRTNTLYFDRTGTKFTTAPGATITMATVGAGTWMHNYVYIDYDKNGVFDVNEANCYNANVDGDLVCHTGYTGVNGSDPTMASDGKTYGNETGAYPYNRSYNLTLPTFILPADLAPGEYRCRHKLDWNCVDPCGRLSANKYSGNLMDVNRGMITDFTIVIPAPIAERTITVQTADETMGTVAIVDPATAGNSVTTSQQNVTVEATPAEGYEFVNWISGTDVVSVTARYTYSGEENIDLVANFRKIPTYVVTINQADYGTITVTAAGVEVSSGSTVYEGTVLTLSNTPVFGFHLANYLVNGVATADVEITVNADVTISGEFVEGIDYCTPTAKAGRPTDVNNPGYTNYTNPYVPSDHRAISSIVVTDGNSELPLTITESNVAFRLTYYDYSESVLTTQPGATVTLTVNTHDGNSGWMYTYIYADFNKNGFSAGDRANDLVATNYELNQGRAVAGTFNFVVPSDLAEGEYRVRYILDWNSAEHPCIYGNSSTDDGEAVVDFTIRISAPEYKINYTYNSERGEVVVADGYAEGAGTITPYLTSVLASGSVIKKDVCVVLVPKQYNGEINNIESFTINGADAKDALTEAVYPSYANVESGKVSDAQCWYVVIPKSQVESQGVDQNINVVFEDNVQGVDGIGIDAANGPVEYYNINGVRVGADNLTPGFYIIRQGEKAAKVFINK